MYMYTCKYNMFTYFLRPYVNPTLIKWCDPANYTHSLPNHVTGRTKQPIGPSRSLCPRLWRTSRWRGSATTWTVRVSTPNRRSQMTRSTRGVFDKSPQVSCGDCTPPSLLSYAWSKHQPLKSCLKNTSLTSTRPVQSVHTLFFNKGCISIYIQSVY